MSTLMAGIGRSDLTPPTGTRLAAEFSARASTGVRTPLEATAAVLAQGEARLAFLALDAWGLGPGDLERLRRTAADASGISAEAILIAFSGTRCGPHTAPIVGVSAAVDAAAVDRLLGGAAEALADAARGLQPASVGAGHATLPHLLFNHRLLTRNWRAVSAWMGVPADEVLEPEGPVDARFSLIVVRDAAGHPLALLWSFGADNRFPGGTLACAGVPGKVRELVARRLGRSVACLALGGCSGDASWHGDLDAAADAAASAVVAVTRETSTDASVDLASRSRRLVLPVRDHSALFCRGDIELKKPDAVAAYEREIVELRREGAAGVEVTVQAFRIGNAAVVGLPGQPFAATGLAVQKASPFGDTMVTGNTGPAIGPVPTREAFEAGGFETWPSRSAVAGPGSAEGMAAEAADLLAALRGGRGGR